MPHVVAVDRVPVERQRGRDPDLLAAELRLPPGRVPVVAEGLDAPEHRPGDAADARGLDALRQAPEVLRRDSRVAGALEPEVAADDAVGEPRGARGRLDAMLRPERVED